MDTESEDLTAPEDTPEPSSVHESRTLDDSSRSAPGSRLFDFASTRRFSVLRRIGAGGMGVVYEALDRERGERVALKTLLGMDPVSLYRFKREFRTLADVNHPNLVTLHELFSEDDQIFFTMELIHGVPFLDAIWANGPAAEDSRKLSITQLRACLRQLVEGLMALHAAGKLHRDIKPSNVMIQPDGRVVILDFGLAGDTIPELQSTGDGHVLGTPAYMAPEQAAGDTLTPAADWYSVGVMLYQALTGSLPFRGKGISVLLAKQESDGPRPSSEQTKIPLDLDEVGWKLLRMDPARRPTGPEILRTLRGPESLPTSAQRSPPVRTPGPFVGRESHLNAMQSALESVLDPERPQPVVVHVRGRSGMGKSALVRQFLTEVRRRPAAVVLDGRCYERESVPYKAVDDLIDALCRHLLHLSPAEASALMPRHVAPLARLFPVLQRVECIANAPQHLPEDPHELRQRAFEALKELLARIADRGPLVLHIDDLQWGDLDSAQLLTEVLRAPEAPNLLLVACSRTDEEGARDILAAFPVVNKRGEQPTAVHVSVDPLTTVEAHRLALALLAQEGHGGPGADTRAAAVASESAGSPFFVGELVRYAGFLDQRDGATSDDAQIRLDNVVRARVRELDDESRRLLEVVAISGRPTRQAIVLEAADLASAGYRTIRRLCAEHLVRTRGASATDTVESYHDRIRESVVDAMPAETWRAHHRALAVALERNGVDDPEVLAVHHREGGQWLEAGEFAAEAARAAAQALAFDRAARMFRLALELLPDEDPRRLEMQIELGDALLYAGRPLEGAHSFLEAIPRADPERALELRQRAAEQLLRNGQVDEGLAMTREVLATFGMRLPRTPLRTFASFLASSARLRFRDLTFDRKPESRVPAPVLERMDICESLANGLAGVNVLLAWDFQTRQTLLALDAGEPSRVARALAMQSAFASLAGAGGSRHAQRLYAAATDLAQEVDDPNALGLCAYSSGLLNMWNGDFVNSHAEFDRALSIFRDRVRGVPWHQGLSELFSIITLSYLGEFKEMARRHTRALREFRARDDRYTWVGLQLGKSNLVWLLNDDPQGARHACEEALDRWSSRGYQAQHYWGLLARVQADVYEGHGREAVDRIAADWPRLCAANLTRIQILRLDLRLLRARACLCAAESEADPSRLLAQAEKDAHAVARERMPWASPLARMVHAAAAHLRGNSERALAMLEACDPDLERHSLKMWRAATAYAHAHLRGAAGHRALSSARRSFVEEGVVDPGRMVRLLAPGFRAHLA